MTSTVSSLVCGLLLGLGLILLLAAHHRHRLRPPLPRFGLSRSWLHPPRLVLAGIAALLVGGVTGWPVAALSVAIGLITVPHVLRPPGPQQDLARVEALAAWCQRLADLLAAGTGGLSHTLTRSAETCPPALAGPVQRLVDRQRHEGMERGLRAFADELADPRADEIVLALLLRANSGGRGVAMALQAHAETLSAEVAGHREIDADRATSRTTVRALIGITVVLMVGLVLLARTYLAPFATAAGQGVLALAMVLAGIAIYWMSRLTRPVSHSRYLTPRSSTGGAV